MSSVRKSLPISKNSKNCVTSSSTGSKSDSPNSGQFQVSKYHTETRRASSRKRNPSFRIRGSEVQEKLVGQQIIGASSSKSSNIHTTMSRSSMMDKKTKQNFRIYSSTSINPPVTKDGGNLTNADDENSKETKINTGNLTRMRVRKRRFSGGGNDQKNIALDDDSKTCKLYRQKSINEGTVHPVVSTNLNLCKTISKENDLGITTTVESTKPISYDENIRYTFRSCECLKDSLAVQDFQPLSCQDTENTRFCGAVERVGSVLLCCAKSSRDSRLYRVSQLTSFRSLCSLHFTRQRSHQCCPLCGSFCIGYGILSCTGSVKQSSLGNSIRHMFHKACALRCTRSSDQIQCPHCGETKNVTEIQTPFCVKTSESLLCVPDRKLRNLTYAFTPTVEKPEIPEDQVFNEIDQLSLNTLSSLIQLDLEGLHLADGETVLSDQSFLQAIERHNLLKVFRHLTMSTDPNTVFPSHNMKTALHLAVESGDTVLVHLICQAEIETNLDIFDGDGITPLMLAAKLNNSVTINYLISISADHFIQDKNGWTILHHAVGAGGEEAVRAILEYDKSLLNISENMGLTPLMLAAKNKYYAIADCLSKFLENERRAILELDKENNTSLHWIATIGHGEIASRLLKQGAFINAQNKKGETPLHVAVNAGQFVFASYLLKKGANSLISDKEGNKIVDIFKYEKFKTDHDVDIKTEKAKSSLKFMLKQMKIFCV